ncbi:MAG: hypothetical protein M0C28_41890 [Candidatus Moduliflexus flocculans]|nr:hypothetical protein [Candidatus Moduliflexus flocculans]
MIIRDLAIQKRDRDLVIGTYGRGIYIADIAPLKEMNAEILAKDAYLFDVEETDPLEPPRAAGRTVRRVRQGRQSRRSARRSTITSRPTPKIGQDRRQGPRGQRHPGVERRRPRRACRRSPGT